MRYLLLHTPGWSPAGLAEVFDGAHVETRPAQGPGELVVEDRPTIALLDGDTRRAFSADAIRAFVDAGGGVVVLGRPGEADLPDSLPVELLSGYVPHPTTPRQLLVAVRAAFREAAARAEAGRARAEAALRSREIGELTRIGVALGTERDLKALLELILTQARRITHADAGSLYLVETGDDGTRQLRFRLAQTYSKPEAPFVEFAIPVDRASLAGYAAVTGEPLVIDDAYVLPEDVEYTINRSFDERYGYRTKSMLVIPMKDHKEDIIGVLQLINRKRRPDAVLAAPADVEAEVVPFSRRTVELVMALAGEAAVSIENSQLYQDIERLFEGFVKAAVLAIEQRDPSTFGHSGRVAGYTVALAEIVDGARDGLYHHHRFTREQIRELRYAALLHDFGKVGVREEVLVKAKKLYPAALAVIRQRHAFIHRTAERDFWRRRAEFLERPGAGDYRAFVQDLEAAHAAELEELDAFVRAVVRANEPTVLPAGSFEELAALARRTYVDLEGVEQPLLTAEEMRYLTIRKGSLDEQERLEIESHVTHTWRFLQQIPWTRELHQVPLIAYGHHEKLDGGGYPRGVGSEAIPIQTRIMTISDIYDALTAQDRPYKLAVSHDRALDILTDEVKAGQLDGELFRLFVDARVFDRPPA